MATTYNYFSRLTPDRVDKEAGIIRGVSVITGGVQAKGHPLICDDVTVQEMFSACESKGQIKTKANHKSGVKEVNGYLSDFRIVQCPTGEQLKADWHLLHKDPNFQHTLEIAERMPKTVGLSASFTSPKGKEKGEVTRFGKAARVKEVLSVDFVTDPAANPDGLFEIGQEQVDNARMNMAKPTSEEMLETLLEQTTALSAEVAQIREFNNDLLAEREAYEQAQAEEGEGDGEGDGEDEGEDEGEDTTTRQEDPRDVALSRALERIEQLESRNSELDQTAELEQYESAFALLEQQMTELAAQRDEALAQLEERMAPSVSASSDGVRMFSAGASGQSEFDQYVSTHKERKQSRTEAIREFIATWPDAYREHLESKVPVASM